VDKVRPRARLSEASSAAKIAPRNSKSAFPRRGRAKIHWMHWVTAIGWRLFELEAIHESLGDTERLHGEGALHGTLRLHKSTDSESQGGIPEQTFGIRR
jgi:hypothetical protein